MCIYIHIHSTAPLKEGQKGPKFRELPTWGMLRSLGYRVVEGCWGYRWAEQVQASQLGTGSCDFRPCRRTFLDRDQGRGDAEVVEVPHDDCLSSDGDASQLQDVRLRLLPCHLDNPEPKPKTGPLLCDLNPPELAAPLAITPKPLHPKVPNKSCKVFIGALLALPLVLGARYFRGLPLYRSDCKIPCLERIYTKGS